MGLASLKSLFYSLRLSISAINIPLYDMGRDPSARRNPKNILGGFHSKKNMRGYKVTRLCLAKCGLTQEWNLACWAVQPRNLTSHV